MVWKCGSLEEYSVVAAIRYMNRLLRRLFSFSSFKTFWREIFVFTYECSGIWCGVYGVSVEKRQRGKMLGCLSEFILYLREFLKPLILSC